MRMSLLWILLWSFSASAQTMSVNPPRDSLQVDQLKSDEREIYRRGRISEGEWVAGGLLGTLVGFGTGHIVYDQYLSKGWIFTVGEAAGVAVMVQGVKKFNESCSIFSNVPCQKDTSQLLLGVLIVGAFHIWEVIDVWMYPASHNRRYESIRERMTGTGFSISPYVSSGETTGYGLQLGFRF